MDRYECKKLLDLRYADQGEVEIYVVKGGELAPELNIRQGDDVVVLDFETWKLVSQAANELLTFVEVGNP